MHSSTHLRAEHPTTGLWGSRSDPTATGSRAVTAPMGPRGCAEQQSIWVLRSNRRTKQTGDAGDQSEML